MSGQTMIDRLTAARHSIAGHGLAKSVCKATTEEVMGPKKKHIDYLVQCTNEPNVSIPQMADLLIERTQNANWVVVFKSLISMHNLMNYGNERFTQYLASNNCTVNLGNFLDKSGVQGYDMSTFIRRYAKYLNEKAYSYRQMAFDFCKIKRGKDDGTLRTMTGDKLLKTLPVLQNQLDALLEFDCTPNELTNGVINACFMLMFKDLIRLFACYNDGIINLLEKYFEMNKKQCKEALDLYKKFLVRMERVSEFLKVAESVGIDKGDIPDLAKAPSSLLDALEQHLASLESSKKGEKKTKQPESVSTAISTLAASASGGPGASTVSEDEKRKILEEESRQLQMLKEEQEKAHPTNPFANALDTSQEQRMLEQQSTNPFSSSMNGTVTSPSGGLDLLGAGSPTSATAGGAGSGGNDLLSLSGPNPFAASLVQSSTAPTVTVAAPAPGGGSDLFGAPAPAPGAGSPWGTTNAASAGSPASATTTTTTTSTSTSTSSTFASDAQFAAVFGSSSSSSTTQTAGVSMVNNTHALPPGFDALGEVMRPSGGLNQPAAQPGTKPDQKLIQGSDLDMSLTSLASNLNINSHGQAIKKTDHQWKPTGERKLTGGMTWAQPMAPTASATFTSSGPMQGQQVGMVGPRSPGFSMPAMNNGMPAMNNGMPAMNNGMPAMNNGMAAMNNGMPMMNGMTGMNNGMAGNWQQAGMMGAPAQQAFGQQPMGFGQPMGMQPMGMSQGPMFGGQPGMQPQTAMFAQPRPPQPSSTSPNDPFGAL